MKKILTTAIMGAALATSASAINNEYTQLYKDPKVMGMGGANVAVGGHASSLFYNPAGLSYIPREYGIEVELINLNISANENIADFVSDMDDASEYDANNDGITEEWEETIGTLNVMEQYLGENIHVDVNNFTSISRKGEKIGFALGAFGSVNMDYKTHRPLDKVLEVKGLVAYGAAAGFSYDMADVSMGKYELNDFSLGLGAKYVTYSSIDHQFSISELVDHDDDMDDYLMDEIAKEGTSTVFDLGGTYKLTPSMIAGVSVMNIGGIGDKDSVYVPMTVNAGIGYLKRWEGHHFFNQVRLAADYVDMTGEYEQDDDMLKRTRLGVETNVWDGWFSTFTLRAGLYQAAPTFGMNLRLTMLQIGYAYYQEEVGAYAGQDPDARHMLNITFGW